MNGARLLGCGLSTDQLDSFRRRVGAGEPDECWPWLGYITALGYGSWTGRFGPLRQPRTFKAHRLAFLLAGGVIGAGLELDHLCRLRHCVNPAHLEAVTHAENMRRCALANKCRKGHDLLAGNVVYERGGTVRRCRICRRASARRSQRNFMERQRAAAAA